MLTALGIRRDPNVFVWWGVPYNPYGTAAAYNHLFTARFFDFDNEVKLGDAFWNFIGGAPGTYSELVGLYRDVGIEYTGELDALREAFAGRPV